METWTFWALGYKFTEQLENPQVGDIINVEGFQVKVTMVDRKNKTLNTIRVS